MGLRQASAFDDATAVRRTGEGSYDIQPDQRFAVVTPASQHAVNGGVLIATMLRAILAESVHPYPVATSAHFLRVPRIAPAQVRVTWLKTGRTVAVARASLVQEEFLVIEATVATGALGHEGPARGPVPAAVASPATDGRSGSLPPGHPEVLSWTGSPPRLPPAADCVSLPGTDGYHAQVDIRLDPGTAGWLTRKPGGMPEMRGYFRLHDGRDPDAYLLALAVDALPPVVFGLGAVGWAPTVELTWYMRAVPAAGPLRVAARCRHVSGGWFDEESEVWDSAGQLVAQSRQLARVGR
jgi:acyl-coenzyme A thioesterase PaaI-like protein